MNEELVVYLQQLWELGFQWTALILCSGVLIWHKYRCWRLFWGYIEDGTIDSFDDSMIFETPLSMGTNPFGIVIDFVIYCIICIICALVWPLFWPIGGLTLLAIFIRFKRQKAERVVARLKGEPEY